MKRRVIKKYSDIRTLILLSLVFPFMSFILVSNRLWIRSYHLIILIFSFWFGFYVHINDAATGDITRYKNTFESVGEYSYNDYFFLVTNSYSPDKLNNYATNVVNSKPDIYALSLQFFISRLTSNFRWFFAFVSFFYTLFFLKFLSEVYRLTGDHHKSKIWRLFFVSLAIIVPFYVGVTGVRFWTALFLFMWQTIKYIRTKSSINIVFAGCAIFIHYTFMFPLVILIIYRFLNISKTLMKIFVFVSMGIFVLTTTTGLLGYASEVLELFEDSSVKDAADSYTNEDDIQERSVSFEKTNWYVQFREVAIMAIMVTTFLLEFLGLLNWKMDKRITSWNSLYVLFFCILMLSYGLGSIARFKYVFFLLWFIRMLLIIDLNRKSHSLHVIYRCLLPAMVLHFFVICRAGFYYIDPLLIVGNPVVFFVTNSSISLSELIVGH